MQYPHPVIPISFSIAYPRQPVNPLTCVSSITLLLLEDDTSDVVSPPTYYATRSMFRSPETFAFPTQSPTHQFRTFVPCLSPTHMHPRFYVSRITPGKTDRRVSTPC